MTPETKPSVEQATVTDDRLLVDLLDGQTLSVPCGESQKSLQRWISTKS